MRASSGVTSSSQPLTVACGLAGSRWARPRRGFARFSLAREPKAITRGTIAPAPAQLSKSDIRRFGWSYSSRVKPTRNVTW